MQVLIHNINIININHQLKCILQFKAMLV